MTAGGFADKARFLREFVKALGLGEGDILQAYEVEFFCDGFPKIKAFKEVFAGELSSELVNYLRERLRSSGLCHHRDARNPCEYGVDLVRGWIYEDAVARGLGLCGMRAEAVGKDRQREFLNGCKVGSDADFMVHCGGSCRMVEAVSDYTGYWSRNDRVDLRDFKYDKIMKQGGLLLGLSLATLDGFVLCPLTNRDVQVRRVPRHRPYGDKPAVSVLGISEITKPVSELFRSLTDLIAQPATQEAAT
jgi:hypothetical protein